MISKLFRKENMNIWLPPIFVILLTIILLILNVYVGIVGVVLSLIASYNAWDTYTKKDQAFKDYAENLEIYFEGFSKKAIFEMPFSLIVINDKNELVWYNSRFKKLIDRKESLIDERLNHLLPGLMEKVDKSKEEQVIDFEYEQRNYEIHTSRLEKEKISLMYFVDHTDRIDTLKKYENEQLVMMNIRLDNIDELNNSITSDRRPILYAEIDTLITSYFHKYGSFIKKNDNGRYVAMTFYSSMKEMMEDKFSFVDEVRSINSDYAISPTLSIGIGYNEMTPRENEKSANAALDIALGRGGDQIVVKKNDELEYFGGKSQATEKRNKVKARVVAHALRQLIDKSTDVYISGHINPDMDSLGSSIGLWHAVSQMNKNAYIVLSEITPAIENIYEYAVENIAGFEQAILKPDEAYNRINASSLFIITDNHRKNSTEEPRLFEKTDSLVIIDHHRRGNDYIDNATLTYLEPSSSSASELVTEMLIYMDDKMSISKEVAESLLAGITVDTKNFTQQTGARTFEAATILKQSGANTNTVNKLFREDFDTIKNKSEIVSGAEIYKDIFAIGIFDKDIEESTLIASQAANELINIAHIEASFVLTRKNGKTHISARSNENISVQLIMEKLNGGGHRNMAATQLDAEIDEAIDLLKNAIKEYIKEE